MNKLKESILNNAKKGSGVTSNETTSATNTTTNNNLLNQNDVICFRADDEKTYTVKHCGPY